MRLLSTITGRLHWFDHHSKLPPKYAILSHVWDTENGEQSLQDICEFACESRDQTPSSTSSAPDDTSTTSADDSQSSGTLLDSAPSKLDPRLSPKIRGACLCARNLGCLWIWIDSCCIDKTSSAELSEAITSMFAWYRGSEICIAYLEDVPIKEVSERFRTSTWFRRGWTLQEMVAPSYLLFVAQEWEWIDSRENLAELVQSITRVDLRILTGKASLDEISVGERIAWASQRRTTRVEDKAYSLMGILGVIVPIMYGEGEAAFRRLQEEILRRSPDQSLFCWSLHTTKADGYGLLAPRLEAFMRELNGPKTGSVVNIPFEEIPAAAEAMVAAMLDKTGKPKKPWRRRKPTLRGHTPDFVVTPFGIRARVPLIRRKGDENRMHACAVIVLGVRHLTDNIGITLHRVSVAIDGPPHYAVGYPPSVDPDTAVGGQMSRRLFIADTAAEESTEIHVAASILGLDKDLVLNWEEILVVTIEPPSLGVGRRLLSHPSHAPRKNVELVIPPWLMPGIGCPVLKPLVYGGALLHEHEEPSKVFPWVTFTPPSHPQLDETEVQLFFASDPASDGTIKEVPGGISQLTVWVTIAWSHDHPIRMVERMFFGVTVAQPPTVRPLSVVSVGPSYPASARASAYHGNLIVWVEYLRLARRDTLRVVIERAPEASALSPAPSVGTGPY